MKHKDLRPWLSVIAGGESLVSHAGGVLLVETARRSGLAGLLSRLLGPWRRPLAVHDPGKIVTDLAIAVAVGGDAACDIAVLRAQPGVFGRVASDPTVSRLITTLAADADQALAAIGAARAAARERVWQHAGAPLLDGLVVIDMDASLVTAHSEKEDATRTWKRTFGFHPLLAFADHGAVGGGERVAELLRPGKAGSNTAVDHVAVLDAALAQLPAGLRARDADGRVAVLVRTDAAGATKEFAAHLHQAGVQFSLTMLRQELRDARGIRLGTEVAEVLHRLLVDAPLTLDGLDLGSDPLRLVGADGDPRKPGTRSAPGSETRWFSLPCCAPDPAGRSDSCWSTTRYTPSTTCASTWSPTSWSDWPGIGGSWCSPTTPGSPNTSTPRSARPTSAPSPERSRGWCGCLAASGFRSRRDAVASAGRAVAGRAPAWHRVALGGPRRWIGAPDAHRDPGGVATALAHLGIPAMNRAVKDGWQVEFATPPVRVNSRGYQATFSLPMGVTPEMIADKRDVLARNLVRAPLEVWPTAAERAGYVDLWVADPGSTEKPAPPYPLLHDGTADVFAGIPLGMSQRGDVIAPALPGANVAFGGVMGQGKSQRRPRHHGRRRPRPDHGAVGVRVRQQR